MCTLDYYYLEPIQEDPTKIVCGIPPGQGGARCCHRTRMLGFLQYQKMTTLALAKIGISICFRDNLRCILPDLLSNYLLLLSPLLTLTL
jgi:hypothetical protein